MRRIADLVHAMPSLGLYENERSSAPFQSLPHALSELERVLQVDCAQNANEQHVGAIRVFMAATSPTRGPYVFEMRFFPLTGHVGWYLHGEAPGGTEVPATFLMRPDHQAIMYLALRTIQLLASSREPAHHGLALQIHDMLMYEPAGAGYPKLTLAAARTLVRLCRTSVRDGQSLDMQEGAWYAVVHASRPDRHVPAADALEFCIGRAVHGPATQGWYLDETDDVIVVVGQHGRGQARADWNRTLVKIRRDYAERGGRWEQFLEGHGTWAFHVSTRFAEHLQGFVTPDLPEARGVVRKFLTGS